MIFGPRSGPTKLNMVHQDAFFCKIFCGRRSSLRHFDASSLELFLLYLEGYFLFKKHVAHWSKQCWGASMRRANFDFGKE